MDCEGHLAMERHWNKSSQSLGWKDLITGQWKEPVPLLARVIGVVCVFPPGEDKPIWILEPVDSTFKGSNNETMDGNDDGQHPGESHSSGARNPPNINASEPD